MVISFAVCASIMGVALSTKPEFFISVIPIRHHASWIFVLGAFLWQVYTIVVTCGAISFFCTYTVTYMVFGSFWMDKDFGLGLATTNNRSKVGLYLKKKVRRRKRFDK